VTVVPAKSPTPAPTALRADQEDAAAEVLAAAFFGDPLFQFLCPDEARRRRMLSPFHRRVVRLYRTAGRARAVEVDGEVLGVQLGTPPEGLPPPTGPYLRFFAANLLARPSHRPPLSRLLPGIRMLSFVERHHLPDPHWYGGVLGVAPTAQGRGVGRALLGDVFGDADAGGRPVYLETTAPDNVPLYEHFGFEVRDILEPPGDAPTVWTMLRPTAA